MQNRGGDGAPIQVMKNTDKSKFRVTATYQVGNKEAFAESPRVSASPLEREEDHVKTLVNP
jgi:hypothetical protein